MSDWPDIKELVKERDAWIKEYGVTWGSDGESYDLDDLTDEVYAKLVELNKEKLVWTNHSTCEDDFFSAGMNFFGECGYLKQGPSGGCGCWQTHAFYVATKPWTDEYERIRSTAYIPCPVCNEDGEDENIDSDCRGPKLPKTKYGVDTADGCDEGWINVYLD